MTTTRRSTKRPAAPPPAAEAPNRFKTEDTLAERAYIAIEEMIMTAELPPNTFISETTLSEDIGIGRTPVREALKRLEADGLVDIVPSRGILVTEVDLRQQLMVLEVRGVLERLVAVRAARHASVVERRRFLEIARQMEDAAAKEDGEAFMRFDQEFNHLLDHAARNPVAIKSMRPLRSMSRRFWFQNYAGQAQSLALGAQTHTAVMRAVADGDTDGAAKAMDALMNYVVAFARATLNEFE